MNKDEKNKIDKIIEMTKELLIYIENDEEKINELYIQIYNTLEKQKDLILKNIINN